MSWIALDIETKSPNEDKNLALDFTQAQIISLAWWSPKSKGATSNEAVMLDFFAQHANDQFVFHNGFYLDFRQ